MVAATPAGARAGGGGQPATGPAPAAPVLCLPCSPEPRARPLPCAYVQLENPTRVQATVAIVRCVAGLWQGSGCVTTRSLPARLCTHALPCPATRCWQCRPHARPCPPTSPPSLPPRSLSGQVRGSGGGPLGRLLHLPGRAAGGGAGAAGLHPQEPRLQARSCWGCLCLRRACDGVRVEVLVCIRSRPQVGAGSLWLAVGWEETPSVAAALSTPMVAAPRLTCMPRPLPLAPCPRAGYRPTPPPQSSWLGPARGWRPSAPSCRSACCAPRCAPGCLGCCSVPCEAPA